MKLLWEPLSALSHLDLVCKATSKNLEKSKRFFFKLAVAIFCNLFSHRAPGVLKNSFEMPVNSGIELEFGNTGFWRERKTRVPGDKPLGAELRTNNKLNPHMTQDPGIEPMPHWWKASALATAPSLLPFVGMFWFAVNSFLSRFAQPNRKHLCSK